MTGVEAFAAAVALGVGLSMTCEEVGPEDPAHWDYDCGIVSIQPVPRRPERPERLERR